MSRVSFAGSLSCALVLLGASLPAWSQGLVFGFPEFPREASYFSTEHPLALFVRSGLTDTLIRRRETGEKSDFEMGLADSLSVSADQSLWSFRLKGGVPFANGKSITGADLLFSLERCRELGILPQIDSLNSRVKVSGGRTETWVDVRLYRAGPGLQGQLQGGGQVQTPAGAAFPLALGDCPILEERSSRLFGDDFGKGSNVVSAGPYVIGGFNLGREIVLARSESDKRQGVDSYTLRTFEDAKHALMALRTGTLDALFTEDQEVLEKAGKDETLLLLRCSNYMVIRRKGLQLECGPRIDLLKIKYAT